jgi:predicted RecA/RadA family phage recombinase
MERTSDQAGVNALSRRGRARLLVVILAVAGCLTSVAAGALGSNDFTGDVAAPEAASLTLSPAQIDVTSQNGTVRASVRITDDLSGVNGVGYAWTLRGGDRSATGYAGLASGDANDGTWVADLTVPRFARPGRYDLVLYAADRVGNQLQLQPDQLSAHGFPSGFDVTDSDPDVTPPRVTAVTITPSTVDVRNGPANVTIDVAVADTQSGTRSVGVGFMRPDDQVGNFTNPGMTLTSGDSHSGHWTGTGTIPRYVKQGTWSLSIQVIDEASNARTLLRSDLSGLTPGFTVLSDEDAVAPDVASVTFSPFEVNVHDSDQVVHVRLRVTDARSGTKDIVVSDFDWIHAQGNSVDSVHNGRGEVFGPGHITLVSGDAADGTYEGDLVIPKSSATGLRETAVVTRDVVGNQAMISGKDLVPRGGVPSLLVYNVPLPPVLQRVDPRSGAVELHWDAPIDDRGAAVTGYTIIETTGQVRVHVGAEVRSAVVDGLTNGVRHDFAVVAANRAGDSDPSTTLGATPLAGLAGGGGGVGPAAGAGPSGARSGYWMLGANGSVSAFGAAPHLGDAASGSPKSSTFVDLEPTAARDGYWILDRNGGVRAFGAAPSFGPAPKLASGETVTSLSGTPTGAGYWLFTTRGRAIPYGDAVFRGDMAATRLNAPVIASVATPTGRGYYMVAADGGVFTFGDAAFAGSTGGQRINAPVRSLVPDPDGSGYWLVAADGGIFAFDSPFHGSTGALRLNRPVTGMVGSRTGGGYLMVAEDGGIFAFGDVPFHGSLGAAPPPWPIVAAATL